MKQLISVTRKHIDDYQDSHSQDPIAGAFKDIGYEDVEVACSFAKIGSLTINLPNEAEDWIINLIKTRKGEPFQFEVDIPHEVDIPSWREY